MSEWQPIETAPKDGSPILCFNPFFGCYNSSFVVKKLENGDNWEGYPCGFSGGTFGDWFCKATHWMPFPEPPK